jgi:hypothetical protein
LGIQFVDDCRGKSKILQLTLLSYVNETISRIYSVISENSTIHEVVGKGLTKMLLCLRSLDISPKVTFSQFFTLMQYMCNHLMPISMFNDLYKSFIDKRSSHSVNFRWLFLNFLIFAQIVLFIVWSIFFV